MKQYSVYLLLLVFLMYQAGYYLCYLSMNHYNEESWNSQQAAAMQYSFIEKSIPITFAYQHDQEEFLPVMQGIEVNGNYYRVVKQRYAKDTLHVMYIADVQRENMNKSLKDWVNTISQQSSPDKKSVIKDGLEKNYLPCSMSVDIDKGSVFNTAYSFTFIPDLLLFPADVLKPPPRFS